MRRNDLRTNKQVIKALAIGLSAAMALQPVAALAEETKPEQYSDEEILVDEEVVAAKEEINDYAQKAEELLDEAEQALENAKNAYAAEEGIIAVAQADVLNANIMGGMANGDVVMNGYFSEYVEDKSELSVFNSVSDNTEALVDEYNETYNDISNNYNKEVAAATEALDVSYNELAAKDVSNNTGVQVESTQNEYDETVAASTKAAKLANAAEADEEAKKAETAYEEAKSLYDEIEKKRAELQEKLDNLAVSANEDIDAMQDEIDALEARVKVARDAVDAAKWRLDLANFWADAWDNVGDASVNTVSENAATISENDASANEAMNVILNAQTALEEAINAADAKVNNIESDIKKLTDEKSNADSTIESMKKGKQAYDDALEVIKNKDEYKRDYWGNPIQATRLEPQYNYRGQFGGYKTVYVYETVFDGYYWWGQPKTKEVPVYEKRYSNQEIERAEATKNAWEEDSKDAWEEANKTSQDCASSLAAKNSELTAAKAEKTEVDLIKQIANEDIITQDEVLDFLDYEWITVDGLNEMYRALNIRPSRDGKITVSDFAKILDFIETRESGHYNEARNDEQNFEWSSDKDNQYTTKYVPYYGKVSVENREVINEYLRILKKYDAISYGMFSTYYDDEKCIEGIEKNVILEAYLLEESQLASMTLDAKLKEELIALKKAEAAKLLATAVEKQKEADAAQDAFDAELANLANLKAQLATAVEKLSSVQYSNIEKVELAKDIAELNIKIVEAAESVEAADKNAEKAREIANAALEHARNFIEYTPSNNEDEEDTENETTVEIEAITAVTPAGTPIIRTTVAAAPAAVAEEVEAPAEEEVAEVEIEDEETALADAPEVEEAEIADEETPLASMDEQSKMSWWWILVVLVLGTAGAELYRRQRVKKNAEKVEK